MLTLPICCRASGAGVADGGNVGPPHSDGYELSVSDPTARQAIDTTVVTAERQKFVQVEVTQVTNPQRIPLSFNVEYQPPGGEAIFLGSFGLFPPDNPGTFIVATQGKLRASGTVSVTLVPLQRVSGAEQIRVRVGRLSFRVD
jgi:hypothetical protein